MSDDRGIGLKGWLAGQKPKSPRAEDKTEAISLEKHRVAVLPLANLTPDPSDEYFADGMTEELISTLANISGLRVISRTSILQYKNTSKKVSEIGRDLAAGSIIEGSVRKAGNQLRISVQLIDAQEDEHLWAQTYERGLQDVFAVQSDIARNVSEALKVKLLPRESALLQKSPTLSMEAYMLYLKGRYYWNKRTEEAVKIAREYFQSAIGQDPDYALAYTGLADCYNVDADWGYMPAKDAYAMAKKAALKALELDNNLAEAHAALGLTLMSEWNWTAAETEYRRAFELNPNYASTRQWYSMLLAGLGRGEEALAEIKGASKIDPLSPVITFHMGMRLFETGEYDLSAEEFKKALELQPDFPIAFIFLAAAHAKKSMFKEALEECDRVGLIKSPDAYTGLELAYVYALCGRKDEARRILREQAKNLESDSISLVYAARVHYVLGDSDKAMKLLESGYESHNPGIYKISLMDSGDLLSDQRVIIFQKKIGLRK